MSEPWGVSVVVVNYNNEPFLQAAIDGALAQDHPFCEAIVVDDCSTDNSREVIASYGSRIRPVLHETNGHQIAALNSAAAGFRDRYLSGDGVDYPACRGTGADRGVPPYRDGHRAREGRSGSDSAPPARRHSLPEAGG